MIDVDALKLEVETLLTGLVGTYTFSGGQQCDAIRVDDGADPYPEEPLVEGLEVVIRPETEIAGQMMLAGDRRLDFTSQVVLKQWQITENTQAAREALIKEMAFTECIVVPRSTVLDTVEVCTITLDVESFHVMHL